jgi:hypothetical protein
MQTSREAMVELHDTDPPGIVIRGTFGPTPRPAIAAFIWGGKVRPVPALPFGRPGDQASVV